jgi:hypothetical protein
LEVNDGLRVHNIGSSNGDGAQLTPLTTYEAISFELYLRDIDPGAEMSIKYFTETDHFMYGLEIECEKTDAFQVNYIGDYDHGLSCVGTDNGRPVFTYPIETGTPIGAFVSDNDIYPTIIQGIANGNPSIMSWKKPDERDFMWENDINLWVVDHIEIRQTSQPSNATGISRCDIQGDYPVGTLEEKGEFLVKNPFTSDPVDNPTINGPTNGKTGKACTYIITATDPNDDDIYYFIYWGDNTSDGWMGPYQSGNGTTLKHVWGKEGTYTIRTKVRDTKGFESEWATLDVTIPRNRRAFNSLFQRFKQNNPHLLLIIQELLNRIV